MNHMAFPALECGIVMDPDLHVLGWARRYHVYTKQNQLMTAAASGGGEAGGVPAGLTLVGGARGRVQDGGELAGTV